MTCFARGAKCGRPGRASPAKPSRPSRPASAAVPRPQAERPKNSRRVTCRRLARSGSTGRSLLIQGLVEVEDRQADGGQRRVLDRVDRGVAGRLADGEEPPGGVGIGGELATRSTQGAEQDAPLV